MVKGKVQGDLVGNFCSFVNNVNSVNGFLDTLIYSTKYKIIYFSSCIEKILLFTLLTPFTSA